MHWILGISAFYHDSAAVLLRDGHITAAAQEERFSRRKNDESFPGHAVAFCLNHAGIGLQDVDAVVFYDKPILKFARILESFLAVAPAGLLPFLRIMPGWLGEKLNLRHTIRAELPDLPSSCPILFTGHHEAHAASAFLPSPFPEAAILTVDGVGEWATTTIGFGKDRQIQLLQEIHFPHSLGLLYSAFTAYCGFRVNSGEYKLMGLAPYGSPRYADRIRRHLIDLKPDGSFRLDLSYFHFLKGFSMTNQRFEELFDGPPRIPEAPLEPRHMDVAASIQLVTEEVMLTLAREARSKTGLEDLCLAGGVALNCVANGRILRERIFRRLWIQPAAGDAGGALGAALLLWHRQSPRPLSEDETGDAMQGAALGPEFSPETIEAALQRRQAIYERCDAASLISRTADLLANQKVVGWFQGRMEFGPRALGHRSILADPRTAEMQSLLNLKIKFRESFRPFAPVVREEDTSEYFEIDVPSPYMLLTAHVKSFHPKPAQETKSTRAAFERLKSRRSDISSVTHIDGSARLQTVSRARNPLLHDLLGAFKERTGCGVLVNTSFNVRGEPIIATPDHAYHGLVSTQMDALAMGPFLLIRQNQPAANLMAEPKLGID